jgi:signal transduction histidine kinase
VPHLEFDSDRIRIKLMAHDELAQALEQLADMGHLASGVGHHVINAFSAIVSNAEILRLGPQMSGTVDPMAIADMIIKTALDASTVARRLIDMSRAATAIGSGSIRLDELAGAVIAAERAGHRPRVEWITHLEAVPPIIGSEVQLRAMMGHLLANAYEAMPPGGGTVTVSTALDPRGWIVLEVRDSGPGMPPPTLERAVEPFFTTKPGHLGIGLSIANGIWRRHHGTLALRSQPGEGTTVRLCVDPNAQPHGPPGAPKPG